ncbi:MAG: glycoside hydrolase [Oscillospiraceae bacterium]|jgi:hypothetical protein|nr:glycoside hydrolase [Oscillospiraceae bacterium]
MKKIDEVLKGENGSAVSPFLWLHGEDGAALRNLMAKIDESGIKSVCVESRPHPDFVGKKWWKDMDVILQEAKTRNMGVWILDDSHFPTGYANGRIQSEFPHLRKRFLSLKQLDFFGPVEHAEAIIRYAFTDRDDKLVGVMLGKKISYTEIDPDSLMDITSGVRENGTVQFNLPEGEWRLMVLVSTYNGGEKETEGYLNPIDPDATDVLINTVYEPHYRHYGNEFGGVIQGFFSDEPRLGNVHGTLGSIGRLDMVLPWREDFLQLLDQKVGFSTLCYLPLLFVDGGEKAHQIRYFYMDLVSHLYSIHFDKRLGDWCRSHGVKHIGHTIEDNNAHARLGYGTGHFFRAMAYQDMAGIDVVLHQLLPGMDHGYFKSMTRTGWDGEFFHYALAKLGSSLGHLDPKKDGRTLCEVFGAYGWAEGNKLMKWIADHMLVRGVNYFVPHAFNPKAYPDPDCPPHFYAGGHNPQFRDFALLMRYINRVGYLLSGGVHRAPMAIAYHAEAEWSGAYMPLQKAAAQLTRNQIDFDILPIDVLLKCTVISGRLPVNLELFRGLVIPYAEALPAAFVRQILKFAQSGFQIYVLKDLPRRSSEGEKIDALLRECRNEAKIKIIPDVKDLADAVRKDGLYEIKTSSHEPYLRYYHYEHEDGHLYFFVNEHPFQPIAAEVAIPCAGSCYAYDAMNNCRTAILTAGAGKDRTAVQLNLAPYESVMIVFDHCARRAEIPNGHFVKTVEIPVEGPYQVAFAAQGSDSDFGDCLTLDRLVPIEQIKGKENFAGTIRYTANFSLPDQYDKVKLLLKGVSEGARVWVNQHSAGVRICPPYRYDISQLVQQGENQLTLEVTTTLVRQQYDFLSQFMILEPMGLTGSIRVEGYGRQSGSHQIVGRA